MKKTDYEELLNDLSVAMEHMLHTVELAEHMVSMLSGSSIMDDEEKMETHISQLWGLMAGLVEIARERGKDVDALLRAIDSIEALGQP